MTLDPNFLAFFGFVFYLVVRAGRVCCLDTLKKIGTKRFCTGKAWCALEEAVQIHVTDFHWIHYEVYQDIFFKVN